MHWNEELLLPIKSCAAPSEDQFDQLIWYLSRNKKTKVTSNKVKI
jgi:hypothetical protein